MYENWSKRQLEERLPLQEALGGFLASILEPTWAHVGAENRLESGSGCLLTRTSSDLVRNGSANQRDSAGTQLRPTPKTIVSTTVGSRSAYYLIFSTNFRNFENSEFLMVLGQF